MSVGRAVATLRRPAVALGVAAAIGGLAWVGAPLGADAATMLAIALSCITLWILTPVRPAYTGIVCIGLIGVAFSADLALTGFQSPATWLIGFGLLMGEATRQSGLAATGGRWIVARGVPYRHRTAPRRAYGYLQLWLCLGALALALVVPSALVRVFILAPVLLEISAPFESRRSRIGLFLAPLFATFYGAVGIFTAGLANIIIAGITESVAGVTITWSEWTAVLVGVMGVGRVLLIAGAMYYLFRPDPGASVDLPADRTTALTPQAKRMGLFLLVGVAVWMTDAVHGFHPLYGAIVVVALAFLPGLGVVDFGETAGEVDFTILFFIGAVFAIGEGLARFGIAETAASSLLDVIPSGASLLPVMAITLFVTMALAFLMEGLVVASVTTPVIVSFATDAGLPVQPIVMTEAIALTSYFLPYQSGVLIAILAEDVVEPVELIRVATILTVVTLVVLAPIQFALFVLIY